MWLYGNAVAGVNSRIGWGFFKNPGNNLTPPNITAAGATFTKKFIYAMGTGLVGNQANGQPGYLIRGWFKVPGQYRRMGAGDRIQFLIRNDTAQNLNVCGIFVYKWYK